MTLIAAPEPNAPPVASRPFPVLPAGAGSVTYVVQPAPVRVRPWERPWLWVVAAAALLLAASFAVAPWMAYRAIGSAARYDDPAALAQLVDYDAVRASLRPQLVNPSGASAAPPPPNPLTNPLAALQNVWAHRSWSPAAQQAPSPDAYLSPDALLRVLAGQGDVRRPPTGAGSKGDAAPPWPQMVFFGLHRVRFVVHDPADIHRQTVLTLSRGQPLFDWRLVGVRLPRKAR